MSNRRIGSPCLATGAAGFSDMFTFLKLPYCLAFWAASGTMAPTMGPIVAGFSVPMKGWRWSMWENLWLSALVFILLLFCLPETSSDNILLRRAARLRKVTGNANIRSQSEIIQQHMSAKEMAFEALVKPWEMSILDPAVLFTTLYASICYSIFVGSSDYELLHPFRTFHRQQRLTAAFVAHASIRACAFPVVSNQAS